MGCHIFLKSCDSFQISIVKVYFSSVFFSTSVFLFKCGFSSSKVFFSSKVVFSSSKVFFSSKVILLQVCFSLKRVFFFQSVFLAALTAVNSHRSLTDSLTRLKCTQLTQLLSFSQTYMHICWYLWYIKKLHCVSWPPWICMKSQYLLLDDKRAS